MAQRGGRPRNQLVEDNFSDIITEGKKFPQHKCNHCGHQSSKLASRAQQHLKTCQPFINHQKEVEKETVRNVEKKSNQTLITSSIRLLSSAHIAQLHRANAMAVYMTNIPFNHFENPYVIESFSLMQPGYKPPNRGLIAEKLLNETYEAIKLQVMQRLDGSNYLNFFTDETTNIRKERIINLCCHLPSGVGFHIKATAGLAEKMTAATQADWVIRGCEEATKYQLSRVNCISTDTCEVMRSMWSHIEQHPKMKHVFFVPCDSHGLQLLLKDILKFSFFAQVVQEAQSIVNSFRASPKEMAVLWEYQMKAYNQRRAFVLNVLTRWGTTVALLNSVQKNQQALLTYFHQKKPGIEGSNGVLKATVTDYSFWERLTLALKILSPIDQYQHASEAENYKLHSVAAVWNKIRSHLYFMAKETEEADLHHIAEVIWEDKYLKQSTDLHVIAALLLPKNHSIKVVGVTTENAFVNIMHRFFQRYVPPEETSRAMKDWLLFRDKEEGFHKTADCWAYDEDPELFWGVCRSFASALSILARKVVMLPGNSVLAERSWSAMNLIMNKTRNSLNSINVDKLMFIHMNERALHRPKEKKQRQLSDENEGINEEYLCQMEDELLQQDTMLFESQYASESSKRPASQQLTGDATKGWEDAEMI